jgi:B3/4 domain
MPKLVITDLMPKFPDFRVALVLAAGLAIAPNRSATLESEIAEAEARCRERWSGVELSAIPGVAAWRAAYRAFGVKKTSYRSSVERLIKRVLAGDRLPNVNALVDLYNMVSIESGLCLGGDDLDAIEGDLAFRFAGPGDTFIDMGVGGRRGPVGSAQGRRGRLRRREPCALPALELAPGRALYAHAADASRRPDRAVERLWQGRGGRAAHRRRNARVPRELPGRRRRP